jgi:hypothetical protein
MIIQKTGKISTFGGPHDSGVRLQEGLALIEPEDLRDPWFAKLFLDCHDGRHGLARRLNPSCFYIAARWNYFLTPRKLLRRSYALVEANGKKELARLVDWGPNRRTGREMDLSPGLAKKLQLRTDDTATFTLLDGQTLKPLIVSPL